MCDLILFETSLECVSPSVQKTIWFTIPLYSVSPQTVQTQNSPGRLRRPNEKNFVIVTPMSVEGILKDS